MKLIKKIVTGLLSATMLLSAFSIVSFASETACMLMKTDEVQGTLTQSNLCDSYYMDLSLVNYDVDFIVNADGLNDVFVVISDADDEILYSADNIYSQDEMYIGAADLEPGRYYVDIYIEDDDTAESVDYTLQTEATPVSPEVFSGSALKWNQYVTTHDGESYWQFTLDETTDVNFRFNAPTNKDFVAIVYNERGVCGYCADNEFGDVTLTLPDGTYYVKYTIEQINEDSGQILITK